MPADANAPPTRLPLDSSHATAPRVGPGYVLYVNTEGGSSGLWKFAQGAPSSLWSDAQARVVSAPAISPDGQNIAFVTESDGHTQLRLVRENGEKAHVLASGLELRGAPAWAPDGKFLLYSGADVGTTFPLRAAVADGRALPMRSLVLTRGARRVAFFRNSHTLLVLRGTLEHKDFWLVDLDSGAERQLPSLPDNFNVGDFDIASDGRSIVFERVQANSDLVLIDRAR
jgi:dipeptidyl aminopeptidase/acylaminoacyl peptidase